MKILVTGSTGQVGTEVMADLERRRSSMSAKNAHVVIGLDHHLLDVADREAVLAAITTIEPDVVTHPAAFTAVDACESEVDRAFAVNAFGTRNIAEAARIVRAHVTYVSTDYVFDGSSPFPYREWDEPNPQSVYGRSKLGGERELDPGATIVRTSWVCGRFGNNMVKTILRLARKDSSPMRFVDDQHGCPTLAHDLAPALVDLALGRHAGMFHVTNQGATTWYEFARAIVGFAGLDADRVEPISTAELTPPRPATRPANSVLDNSALRLSGFDLLPDWRDSSAALVADLAD
jgi:dTDP-4-dehydrorhamnose reductase